MKPCVIEILSQFEPLLAAEHDYLTQLSPQERGQQRDELMLAAGSQTGQFLNMLIKIQGSQRILELGTSIGYSTLWLAEAAQMTGGHVTTLEFIPTKQLQAKENIRKAGLESVVDFQLGNALSLLETLSGEWDFVFLDLWKDLYIPCFDIFYKKLATGAIIVADNMIFPSDFRDIMQNYQHYVRSKQDLVSMEINIGQGLELTRKEKS
jgi:predicted O-methyltransferase YrrM